MFNSLSFASPYLALLVLLVLLLFKHFLADFPLQTQYMLKKTQAEDWVGPLTLHAAVHGSLTTLVTMPFIGWHAFGMGLLDFLAHVLIDYWKAHLTHYNITQKGFWVTLGVDQMLHNFTYVAIAFLSIHPSFH